MDVSPDTQIGGGLMAWLRIDDRVRTHPKIALAGPAAAWLWFCGICYCREHLTDGFIPKAVVPSLAMSLPSPWKHAARLVEVKLWDDALGGYQVHDFLDWNPSKAEVVSGRASEADRKRRERTVSGRTNAGVREMSSCVRAGDAGLGSLSGSGDLDLAVDASSISTVAPRWRSPSSQKPGRSVLDGYHYRNCAPWALAACEAGICVPKYLWPQWERRKSKDELTAFVEAWASRVQGDAPERFWPQAFASHFGAVELAGRGDKGSRTMAAAERVVAKQLAQRKEVGDGA